jgi:hypothetical protein
MNATIPASLAAQERATAEAVLASYKLSAESLKLILNPTSPPMPRQARADLPATVASLAQCTRQE